MRRILGWGFQHALGFELRPGTQLQGDSPIRRGAAGSPRFVTEEDWVDRCEVLLPQELRDADHVLVFRDNSSALDFLLGIAAAPLVMQALRLALSEVGPTRPPTRMTDRAVLDQLAWRLVAGTIRIGVTLVGPPVVRDSTAAASSPPAAEAPPPVDRAPAPPAAERDGEAPPPSVVEPLIPTAVDPRVQANSMRRAARQGKPFCEECEKARRARAAAVT
jgi:hypothetical protein